MLILKRLLLVASLILPATYCFAQPHDEVDDAKIAARAAKKTDKLWDKSDEAFHAGDYPTALKYHEQIQKLDPHDVESYSDAAWLMWSMADKDHPTMPQQAMAMIDRGLKANSKDWNMWDEAAKHYMLQMGREKDSPLLPKMQDAFEKAVKLQPANVDKRDAMILRHNLAHAAEKNKNYDLALATWRKLVEDYPDDQVGKNNLARYENEISGARLRVVITLTSCVVAFALLLSIGTAVRRRARSFSVEHSP